jgi:hypothetical protein
LLIPNQFPNINPHSLDNSLNLILNAYDETKACSWVMLALPEGATNRKEEDL